MDLDFLDFQLPRLARRRGPVNVYDLLELGQSETAADQTLAYFLDPTERHGLGAALVDALLSLLTDEPVLDANGRIPGSLFLASRFTGSSNWCVSPQVMATAPDIPRSTLCWPGIIDLYLTNNEHDIAVIIENKIDAPLNNPLETYVSHAIDEGYSTVLLAVLAPYEQTFDDAHSSWVTKAITYRALFERLWETSVIGDHSSALDSNINERRSLALLQQFREIRERKVTAMGYSNETEFVNGTREMLSQHRTAVEEFFDAVQKLNKIFRERSKRLEPVIRSQLDVLGLAIDWEAHGQHTAPWVNAWNAYHLVESDNGVELIMTPDPERAGPILVKAYPGKTYKYYPDYDHVPFGVNWQASDEEVAEAFVAVVRRLAHDHPARS